MAERQHKRATLSGREARQGDIVLRNHSRRWIFIAGIVLGVIVALIVGYLMR